MKNQSVLLFILLLIIIPKSFAQTDNIGSGRSLKFDGTSGLIDLGDVYNDLTLPFTLSFWIKIEQESDELSAIFATEAESSVYYGFYMLMRKDHLGICVGDGFGGNNPAYRFCTGGSIESILNKWSHITCIVRGRNDMTILLNGVDINAGYSGNSTKDMQTKIGENAKIGKFLSNGNMLRFDGELDEIRLWNRARTIEEEREDMCKKINPSAAGLIGYWSFNETSGTIANDDSPSSIDGELIGGVTRKYSGAPIGDVSSYSYTTNNLILDDLSIYDVSPTVQGVHIYKVETLPSRYNFDPTCSDSTYYGVFIASTTTGDRTYNIQMSGAEIYKRDNNAENLWKKIDPNLDTQMNRGEYIATGKMPVLNIFSDTVMCDGQDLQISLQGKHENIHWSTGETTNSIIVKESGKYWATIENDCGIYASDSINVTFTPRPKLDLGSDKILCNKQVYQISIPDNVHPVSIKWHDNSSSSSFNAKESGRYWVEIKNECESATDSINLYFQTSPSVDLGPDQVICNEEYHQLILPLSYPDIEWSNGSSADSLVVNASGKYWVKVKNYCGSSSDTINVVFFKGNGTFIPNIITPNGDKYNQYFKLSGNLYGSSIEIYNRWGKLVYNKEEYDNSWTTESSGTYYYLIKDACATKHRGYIHVIR